MRKKPPGWRCSAASAGLWPETRGKARSPFDRRGNLPEVSSRKLPDPERRWALVGVPPGPEGQAQLQQAPERIRHLGQGAADKVVRRKKRRCQVSGFDESWGQLLTK